MLAPAACYPVYPMAARAEATVPSDGLIFDVASDCFRREPSREIDRLAIVVPHARIRLHPGAPDAATAFREDVACARGPRAAETLGLSHRIEAASDPFFGRGGEMVGRFQILSSN